LYFRNKITFIKRNLLIGFTVTFLGAVLFSTKAIIVKKAFADLHTDALTLLTLRMVFSLPFYLMAAFLLSGQKTNVRFTTRQWLQVILVGLFGYYVSSFLDFEGLQYISAGLERLILFLYPTFVVFINLFFFKQKITRIQQIALLLTYTGIAVAYIGDLQEDLSNPDFLLGSFLVFLCAITYAVYIAGSGKLIPILGANKFTAYAMLSATVGVFVHFLFKNNFDIPFQTFAGNEGSRILFQFL
jgi:drug/metabolite transporter (DMT)-like permease